MAPVHVAQLLAHPAVRSAIERALAARGQGGDRSIVHVNPREEAMLRMLGGSGTINPRTGLRQFDDTGTKAGGGTSSDTGASGGGVTGGTNQGGYGAASDTGGGGYGPLGVLGDIPGALGRVGGFLGRAAGNFGAGWGSQGVGGGYGQAGGGPGGQGIQGGTGSGAGYGGGHSGQNYYSQTYGGQAGGPGGGYTGPPLGQAPAISNMPIAAPVSLTPMMSDTATTDLTGGRFGALPSWATTPYQIGTAPSSYPTPGVNAGLGAPGYAGNPLPDQGGGGAPGGGGGGAPGGGSAPAPGSPGGPLLNPNGTVAAGSVQNLGGQQAVLRQAAGQSGEGYQGTWADAFNQASHNIMAQQAGLNTGPTTTLGVLLQMLGGPAPAVAGGSPRNTGAVQQATLAGPTMGGQVLRQPVQQPVRLAAAPVVPARAPLVAPAKTPLTLMQQMAALNAARTGGKNFG